MSGRWPFQRERKISDPAVRRGKEIFEAAQVRRLSHPNLRTKTEVRFPEASNQVIHPYTDLLLHDMGPALADNRPTYNATPARNGAPRRFGELA
jgi:CxxC motif-containing protein (DUF1111 family)